MVLGHPAERLILLLKSLNKLLKIPLKQPLDHPVSFAFSSIALAQFVIANRKRSREESMGYVTI